MSKAQSNLIKLAARNANFNDMNFDDIVHAQRADDLHFKSSLFETLNLLKNNKFEEKVELQKRFALGNMYHWLNKKKSISRHIASDIFLQLAEIYTNDTHADNANISQMVDLFQPTSEEESFSINVFPQLKDHLNVYDLVEVIRGLDSFFNLVIQKHFDDASHYSLLKIPEFIKLLTENIESEVKSKSEMSFMFSDDSSSVTLSLTEVYRAILTAIVPIYFEEFGLPQPLINSMNLRLIVETTMTLAGEIVELTYKMLNENEGVKAKKDELLSTIKSGNEDEQEDAADALKKLLISAIDKIELNLQLKLYALRHKLSETQSPTKFIFEKLAEHNKEPHFTIYAVNKLLEFKPNETFDKNEFLIYIYEMSETTALLRSEDIQVPDDEMRFFLDRTLKNTHDIETFKKLLGSFRSSLNDKERNYTLHALLQECAMNNRHASALLSFFYSAKFEITYGNRISLVNIEEIANRLGSTYSVTRRFKIAKFIEDALDTGKIKGQPIDLLQNSGYFALVVNTLVNQKELEYAFDQYINVALFFEDYNDAKPRAEYVKRLVNEIDRKIKQVVLERFQDQIDEIEHEREKHEISLYAQTKVITLLTRELDSRRRDQTVKNMAREEMMELIDQFISDARGQYEAEKETRSINIADLYMQIQHHSMRVSVVLGEVRQNYNGAVESVRNLDNYSDVETISVILGGVAVAHREEDLNFERHGLFNIIEDISKEPAKYQTIIIESLDQKHGNIEVKDEMGKTRVIFHEQFNGTNELIRNFSAEVLGEIFVNVILIDLLKEVSDALVSSRNMAKNSMELKTALDDIFNRSSDLLEYSEKEYNRIMGIEEEA